MKFLYSSHTLINANTIHLRANILSRATKATIDLSAVTNNLETLRGFSSSSKVIAVVKADAYGNGAIELAEHLQDSVDMFAVAFLNEALELRQSGIRLPILILQGAHEAQDFVDGHGKNLIWLLHEKWQLQAYSDYLEHFPQSPQAWFKFDTGMHRLGFEPDFFPRLHQDYSHLLSGETVFVTHLAQADEEDRSDAQAQISRFLTMVDEANCKLCIANSATHVRFANARQDYIRLGIALYGSTPFGAHDKDLNIQAVMELSSSVIALRTIQKGESVGYGGTWRAQQRSVIATVALGYADGYPRHAPSGTPAWCNGQLIDLVGRVSMDMLTFDVSHFDDIKIGDKVELWGNNLPINQVAEHIGTIGYELMTRVSSRVPRVYLR